MKSTKFLLTKIVATVLTMIFVLSIMVTSAFALTDTSATYIVDSNGYLTNIAIAQRTDGMYHLSLPANVKTVKGNLSFKYEGHSDLWLPNLNLPKKIQTISIPNNVGKIEAGAFSDCSNLESVSIFNYKGGLKVEPGAFPSSTNILYMYEPPESPKPAEPDPVPDEHEPDKPDKPAKPAKPDKPDKPDKPVAPTEPVTNPQTPVTNPHKAKKHVTTTAPAKETTTKAEETTSDSVLVTDEVPFAEAQSQLSDMNIWDDLVNGSEEETQPAQPVQKVNKTQRVLAYTSIAVVAVSAIVLGYFKFRK